MNIKTLIFFVCLWALSGASYAAKEISLVAMIAAPDSYLDSKVVVKGVLGLSPEEGVLYLDQWSFEHVASANGLKVHFVEKDDYSHFHGRGVIVFGELRKLGNGEYLFFVERVGVLAIRKDMSTRRAPYAGCSGSSQCDMAEAFRKDVVRPALISLLLWSPGAERQVLGTAIHESQLNMRYQRPRGPGRGLFQMEGTTHRDMYETYLGYPSKAGFLRGLTSLRESSSLETDLIYNDRYAAGIAALKYVRKLRGGDFPAAFDLKGQSELWKDKYNAGGKGTAERYISDWNVIVGGGR